MRYLALMTFILLTCSCSATVAGRHFDMAAVQTIDIGVSTKADLVETFGEPADESSLTDLGLSLCQVKSEDGTERLVWPYVSLSYHPFAAEDESAAGLVLQWLVARVDGGDRQTVRAWGLFGVRDGVVKIDNEGLEAPNTNTFARTN